MAATPKVDSVWIGFMDFIPVIGTVKETVELVLALYEGNTGVIREKAKAVENFVNESLKKPGKSVSGKPAAAAAVASDFSGLKNVREVRKEHIIEYMGKGSKRGTKPTPAQQEQRKRRVQDIQRDMLGKIHLINQNFNHELKEELERSTRGEHVFNNGILRFHSGVLAEFVQRHNIRNLRGYNQGTIDELGIHTLPQDTANDIQDNMKVHFDDDEFYVNANAVLYGEYCRVLREALLAVLGHINPGEETQEQRQEVNNIINNMNNFQIYVDQLAKEKWIGNRQDRQTRFDVVRAQVATMYNTDRGLVWCTRVMNVVAPWFGIRQ
ncbi:uncharacterized protein Hap1MRO34_021995 isoform 2-T2 [Clarias gariepinus]|uniref:uncharacterized protein LOC128507781 isoform X2 n=1 Tax=Clarias gariepinus TaxID=13013 RepID=UPI00234CC829|nr:uncharacterized protein LOC128507781 isoform X2 [Clarias gariepinus]